MRRPPNDGRRLKLCASMYRGILDRQFTSILTIHHMAIDIVVMKGEGIHNDGVGWLAMLR
jgi:hypothetical protein